MMRAAAASSRHCLPEEAELSECGVGVLSAAGAAVGAPSSSACLRDLPSRDPMAAVAPGSIAGHSGADFGGMAKVVGGFGAAGAQATVRGPRRMSTGG